MTAPWLFAGAPQASGSEVSLLEGTTFCISDAKGDLGMPHQSGLFVQDTRLLSLWRLTVDAGRLESLRVHHASPHHAMFLLHAPTERPGEEGGLFVTRERQVGEGMVETIVLRNLTARPTECVVRLEVASDFADLFEVKEGRMHGAGDTDAVVDDACLELSLERGGTAYGVRVLFQDGASADASGLGWRVELPGHGEWRTTVQVEAQVRGTWLTPHHAPGEHPAVSAPAERRRQFRSAAPELRTADRQLADVVARSLEDLATLRIYDPARPDLPVIAAGAPWFMALFGRDSLITAMMLLPFDAGLAVGTLHTLATYQGQRVDAMTEEEPGRILHELRFGPAGTLALGGKTTYYGTADATPLFVMALGELLRWQPDLVTDDLVDAADRALDWVVRRGDRDGDGFVEYARSTEQGLANQGWKDSWDGINFADGSMPQAPIALAEVQGYVYAAYLARADIAEVRGDRRGFAQWRDRAEELKAAFDEAFWLPEHGWYAVGLDGDKSPIDALTSNNGHLLWSGIVPEDRASGLVEHLVSSAMSTGWGIRTLASTMGAYNPLSYHNGSVWPHDTAICVAGLCRYGFTDEARVLASGLLDAAAHFGNRLPELFAGFSRGDLPEPVPYPAACAPQAWAAAAPVALLGALLGLEPGRSSLVCRPTVPERYLPLELLRISCQGTAYDVTVDESGAASVTRPEGS